MTKRIAIVGGGYAGAQLAKGLESEARITLIEERSHFVHASALIRALVDPSILDEALIPYDKLLKQGKVVRGSAVSVREDSILLADGRCIHADYIVVATGSENAMPFKAKGADIEGLRRANAHIHSHLKQARTIAIVGAGAVGVELAGEIKHFMPNKQVTLISNRQALFPSQPDKLGLQLIDKLKALGVEILLGVRAENLESTTMPYQGELALSNGQRIGADLIFPSIGSRACPSLLENLPGAQKSTANRIKVDQWMRPSSYHEVFAVGDVADSGDAMTIAAITRQVPWLKKTLLALTRGESLEKLRPYRPWGEKAPIVVTLGPTRGNSYLGVFTAGNFLTRMLKGKDLTTRYNRIFGRQ
ncbi:NAD(P)/FAD-dependent oxidoreductase [Agarilytica rhodophyticola]|uniref:NAD(P)/FAD-dependent oxidoreductase n=1 Tax=Agarilytica rhodophyticola TaxID=1737490 RepID=UPI000B345A2F|nr:FAD-dependent oxidoreductase [Agarilytica rhodophyticola]